MSGPRYPFEPLRDFVKDQNTPLSRLLETEAKRDTYGRARELGTLSPLVADRVACWLGVHPNEIWDTWFEDAADEPLCVECEENPARWSENGRPSVYCSEECRQKGRRNWRSRQAREGAVA